MFNSFFQFKSNYEKVFIYALNANAASFVGTGGTALEIQRCPN